MDFTHIIITRFNVPTKTWSKTRQGDKPLSDKWLQDRFDIFEKYCLPSFKNQSNKNFEWLVFFDVNTPETYLEKIKAIGKNFPIFHPIFVQDSDELHERVPKEVANYLNPNRDFVITTDIDNDDLLHFNYVSTIQEHFQPKHNLVIDLVKGLQVTKNFTSNAFVNQFYMVANPFVSLVESVEAFGTVMKDKHLAYRNYPHYISFDKEPRFIQLIHANNLVNDTILNSKRIANIDFSDYGISKADHFKISNINVAINNINRKFKILGQNMIQKKILNFSRR